VHNAAVPGLKRSLHCPTFVPEVDQLDGGGSPKASAGQSLRCALGSSRFAAPHFPHVPERGFSSAGRPEQSRARDPVAPRLRIAQRQQRAQRNPEKLARSSKTLYGEDDRTRWLARKMGQGLPSCYAEAGNWRVRLEAPPPKPQTIRSKGKASVLVGDFSCAAR
jgi:hypothetical protein